MIIFNSPINGRQ